MIKHKKTEILELVTCWQRQEDECSICRTGGFQFSSVAQSCPTLCDPWIAACQASLSIANSWSLLKLMSIDDMMINVGDAIQPSHLLSSSSPPVFNLSQHQGLFQRSPLYIRLPKYWSFSFNISPSNEHSGLISFRMDRFDLLAVQGTLKSLLQHHSSKASIFGAQLSL